jgi:hypothetical protein
MAEVKAARKGYLERLSGEVEKGAARMMKTWKTEAKRPDQVGEVSYRTLELVHRGAGAAARSLGRVAKATQPPARPATPPTHRHVAHPAPRQVAVARRTGAGAKTS